MESTSSRFSSRRDGSQRKNRSVFIEWIPASWGPITTGTVTTHGFVVCLLPPTMVVLLKNDESFQVLQCLVEWLGITTDGRGHDCRPHFTKQYVDGLFGRSGHRGQRMERFKQFSFKVAMSRFAFTTYAKALTELKTYVRGVPLEDLEGFLIKMQTLDDTIIDFTPPLPKRCVQDYHRHFVYRPVEAQCYVDGCPRPLMSKGYWTEKDKKETPPSPTLLEPWPSDEDEEERNDDDPNKGVDSSKI